MCRHLQMYMYPLLFSTLATDSEQSTHISPKDHWRRRGEMASGCNCFIVSALVLTQGSGRLSAGNCFTAPFSAGADSPHLRAGN